MVKPPYSVRVLLIIVFRATLRGRRDWDDVGIVHYELHRKNAFSVGNAVLGVPLKHLDFTAKSILSPTDSSFSKEPIADS